MKTYTESELQEKFKSAIFNTLVVYNKESFHHTWRFMKNILEELSKGQLGDDVTSVRQDSSGIGDAPLPPSATNGNSIEQKQKHYENY